MIEISTEFDRFKATYQMLADKVWTITKKDWFSDREILEIRQQIYRQTRQQTPNTVTEILNMGKPKTPNKTQHDNDHKHTNVNTDPRGKLECRNH